MPTQATVVNKPLAWHVAGPPPVNPGLQLTITTEPVVPEMDPVAARSELATCVLAQRFTPHGGTVLNKPLDWQVVTPPPLKPRLQVTSTVCPVVPVIDPAAALSEFGTDVAVQGLPTQGATLLNKPVGWHLAAPPPLKPGLQMMDTNCPVVPLIEPTAEWSELATWVGVQLLAEQVTGVKKPFGWHVVRPPPPVPGLQVTVTVCPVVPTMEPAAALSEFATWYGVQLLAAQVTALNKPVGKHVAVPPPV